MLPHMGSQGGSCAAKTAVLGLEQSPTGCGAVTKSSSPSISAHNDSTLKGSGRNGLGGTQQEQQWLEVQKWAFWPLGEAFGCQHLIWAMAREAPLGMLALGVRMDIASLGMCAVALECANVAPHGVPGGGPVPPKLQCWGWNGPPRVAAQ